MVDLISDSNNEQSFSCWAESSPKRKEWCTDEMKMEFNSKLFYLTGIMRNIGF